MRQTQEFTTLLGLLLTGIQFVSNHSKGVQRCWRAGFDQLERTA